MGLISDNIIYEVVNCKLYLLLTKNICIVLIIKYKLEYHI